MFQFLISNVPVFKILVLSVKCGSKLLQRISESRRIELIEGGFESQKLGKLSKARRCPCDRFFLFERIIKRPIRRDGVLDKNNSRSERCNV